MSGEECPVCGSRVAFEDTVHVLVHTKSDEGVRDAYVCRACYEADIEPLLAGRGRA